MFAGVRYIAKVREGSPRFARGPQSSPMFAEVRLGSVRSPRFAEFRKGSLSFAQFFSHSLRSLCKLLEPIVANAR